MTAEVSGSLTIEEGLIPVTCESCRAEGFIYCLSADDLTTGTCYNEDTIEDAEQTDNFSGFCVSLDESRVDDMQVDCSQATEEANRLILEAVRIQFEAEIAAEAEAERLRQEEEAAAAEAERLRLEEEAAELARIAAEEEAARIAAEEAEAERIRLEEEAAAEAERIRLEEEAAEAERIRLE